MNEPLTELQARAIAQVVHNEASRWKEVVRRFWETGRPILGDSDLNAALQQLRNTRGRGPGWLISYRYMQDEMVRAELMKLDEKNG